MAKITGFFSKIKNKLQTDAAPLPPRGEENRNNNAIGSTSLEPVETPPPNIASLTSTDLAQYSQVAETQNVTNQQVVNNVQNNNLVAPQTSVINTGGVSVFQFKNVSGIHIGNNYTVSTSSMESNKSNTKNWKNLKMSPTIQLMMECKDELEHPMMDVISKHLGSDWIRFARDLEYSNGQISVFESDYKGTEEQTYQFILDWSRNDENPTIGHITNLLWEHEQKETVYYMKKRWKKLQDDHANKNNENTAEES